MFHPEQVAEKYYWSEYGRLSVSVGVSLSTVLTGSQGSGFDS